MAKKQFLLKIREDLCKGCGLCVEYCSKNVLIMSDKLNVKGIPFAESVKPESCVGCCNCTVICPEAAIELFEIARENAPCG